ncbi:hypothetical protein PMIN02_010999 [Paraphaeosphaeria minitans]
MVLVLLIGLLICFVCGFLLSVVFFLKDFSWLRKNRHSRFWERAVALLFSTCQGGFSIAGMVAVAIAFTTDTEPYRLDPVTLCTLQLFAGANLTWTLRGIKDCRKAIWLVYGSIAWTAPDIAFFTRYETFPLFLCILLMTGRDNFAYEHALLTRVAIASTVSWGHWHEALQIHKDSGNPIPKRVHALLQFVIANAVAASFQIIGAVVLYGLSLVNVRISELRQGIVLACILAQAGTLIALCMVSLERHMSEPSRRWARTRNREWGGAVRLTSLTDLQVTASSQGRTIRQSSAC